MKTTNKKLKLHPETIRTLTPPAPPDGKQPAAAGPMTYSRCYCQ